MVIEMIDRVLAEAAIEIPPASAVHAVGEFEEVWG